MSDRINEAVRLFEEGFVCSQAVFAAFCDTYGLDKNTALKIANGFGGGIARRQEICGAVAGAVMLLSLKYGRDKVDDLQSHELTYSKINRFCEAFIKKNGSLSCRELLGCNMAEARERGLFSSLCTQLVRDAAELAEAQLSENV